MAIAAASVAAPAAWAAQDAGPKKLPSSVFDWTKLKMETTKVGERRAIFDSPTGTLDRLECHATTINPGEEPHAPHQHPEEEMIIIQQGTVEIMQNGEKTVAGPGSVIFHAPNDMHGARNVGDMPATYTVLKWWTPATAKKAE